MRIAEINDIASVASDLSTGLRGRGHEVTLIQPRLIGGSLPWAIKPVVGPVRAVEWAQIIRQLNRERYDAIHIHYAYLGMLGVLGKLPFLLHCHGSDVRRITPFTMPMVERALRGASSVFYATPDLGAFVLKRRPDATFLPNPVDSQTFAPRAPVTGSRDVYICCSLTDIKGIRRILQAWTTGTPLSTSRSMPAGWAVTTIRRSPVFTGTSGATGNGSTPSTGSPPRMPASCGR